MSGAILFRLFTLQILKANSFIVQEKLYKIIPLRGNIYVRDKDGNIFPVALSYYLYDLYFYPPKASNIRQELNKLAEVLQTNLDIDEKKISDKTSFILKKDLTIEEKKKIEKLKFDSIFFEAKVARKYPLKNFLSSVLGFARFDANSGLLIGQYGLERYYDNFLKGEIGYKSDKQIIKNPLRGSDLVLNIDYYAQLKSEAILQEAVKQYKAEGGLILVSEVKTGNIIAAAELPSYDLNNFNKISDYSLFISRLSKTYEPGSVMKPFFYAGAFAEGLALPSSTYNDLGYVILDGWRIENFDHKGRGIVTLQTALEQSLNTGSVYVFQLLGKMNFLKYINLFRLNQTAEVDFPILEKPNFNNLSNPGRNVNFGTASFGQGISLSPLNLVQSFNVFANKGSLMKLNFVNKIIMPNSSIIKNESQPIANNILDDKTLKMIMPILEGVIKNQAKKAHINGYSVAGKTGSALLPYSKMSINGMSGYSDQVITNFIGFFPASNPLYIVLVRLDKPDKGLLAFGTAAPTFKKIAEFLINYYNLEPDLPEELTKIF